jgi:hypothetical protein
MLLIFKDLDNINLNFVKFFDIEAIKIPDNYLYIIEFN